MYYLSKHSAVLLLFCASPPRIISLHLPQTPSQFISFPLRHLPSLNRNQPPFSSPSARYLPSSDKTLLKYPGLCNRHPPQKMWEEMVLISKERMFYLLDVHLNYTSYHRTMREWIWVRMGLWGAALFHGRRHKPSLKRGQLWGDNERHAVVCAHICMHDCCYLWKHILLLMTQQEILTKIHLQLSGTLCRSVGMKYAALRTCRRKWMQQQ